MKNTARVAVTSRSFSRHPVLRAELLARYENVTFNDAGSSLAGESLVAFLSGHSKAITALEVIVLRRPFIPALGAAGRRISYFEKKRRYDPDLLAVPRQCQGHVIVVGHGRVGQVLCSLLERHVFPFIASDKDPDVTQWPFALSDRQHVASSRGWRSSRPSRRCSLVAPPIPSPRSVRRLSRAVPSAVPVP
jgi:hypothetical protein